MIKDLTKIANRLDSLGLIKEADYLDSIIRKIAVQHVNSYLDEADSLNNLIKIAAKSSPEKPNKKLLKQLADETYKTILNNIEFANSDEDPEEAFKFWEGHIGLNISWAKNRVAEAKKLIMKSREEKLSAKEKSDLKKLIYETMEAFVYTFPIPTTHHKKEELQVFKNMSYEKACKCGETNDEDWYKKNCI